MEKPTTEIPPAQEQGGGDISADKAIELAVKFTKHEELEKGDGVGWTGDNIFYEIKDIQEEKAVIWIPGDEESEKTVDKKELYDPIIAKRMAKHVEENS